MKLILCQLVFYLLSGNPVVDVNVRVVQIRVPFASSNNAPFKVLVTAPVTVPSHSDTPQP